MAELPRDVVRASTHPTVLLHKELAIGTLRSAIRQAGLEPDDFVDAYRGGKPQ